MLTGGSRIGSKGAAIRDRQYEVILLAEANQVLPFTGFVRTVLGCNRFASVTVELKGVSHLWLWKHPLGFADLVQMQDLLVNIERSIYRVTSNRTEG